MDFNSLEEEMKQYKVIKAWPGVEVGEIRKSDEDGAINIFGAYYSTYLLETMLKEGWIEEIQDRKTLEEKFKDVPYYASRDSRHGLHNIAKDHYLGLLDEADKEWSKLSGDDLKPWLKDFPNGYYIFLRKYLESEGKMG